MAYQRKKKEEEEVMETIEPDATGTDVEIPVALEFVAQKEVIEEVQEIAPPEERPRTKTGKVFLTEEDKKLFKKFNQHIVKKLGLTANRSVKI